jgi:hypothetical protein
MKPLLSLLLALTSVGSIAVGATTDNLLVNPGAESGSITGWTPYGPTGYPTVDNGSFDKGINPHSGSYDFVAHSGAQDRLWQTISFTDSAVTSQGITTAMIDAGQVIYNFSFWEQGLNQGNPSDEAGIELFFWNDSGQVINPNPSVFWLDSHNGEWMQYTYSAALPATTRSVDYYILFQRNQGSDNDAFVDDANFTLETSLGSTPTPEPSTVLMLITALALGYRRISRAFICYCGSGNEYSRSYKCLPPSL